MKRRVGERKRVSTLVILPTAGSQEDFCGPDKTGRMRALAAFECLDEQSEAVLAISGGWQLGGATLSMQLAAYVLTKRPDLKERLVLVEGSSDHTVRDIQGVLEYIDPQQVMFVSHPTHFGRVQYLFNSRRIYAENIHSGEGNEAYGLKDTVLKLYGLADPEWKWPSGHLLDRLAHKNVEHYWAAFDTLTPEEQLAANRHAAQVVTQLAELQPGIVRNHR